MLSQTRSKTNLFFCWIGTTTASAVISVFSGHAMDAYIPVISEAYISSLFIIQGAAIIGFVQCLILRRYISRAWLWFPATSIGFLVGTLLSDSRYSLLQYFIVFGFLINTRFWLCGLLAGTLQWFVLRNQLIKSTLWIFASTLGLGIVYSLINEFYLGRGFEISWVIIWLLYGFVQAFTLSWLLQARSENM